MEAAAAFLAQIAYGALPRASGLAISQERLGELGEYLVAQLRANLGVQGSKDEHSSPGQYPYRQDGGLQNSVGFEYLYLPETSIVHGIRFGYRRHTGDNGHENYGEDLLLMGRLGYTDTVMENLGEVHDAFNGEYLISANQNGTMVNDEVPF